MAVPEAIPLKDRVLRSRTCAVSLSTSVLSFRGRPSSYKSYSSQQLSLAIAAVAKGMTVRRAAEEFNVPRSTLHDRISGRVELGARSGPERYLGDQEEEQLVEFLVNCAKIGYACTRSQVMEIVQQCLMMRGLEITVTHGWWESLIFVTDTLS